MAPIVEPGNQSGTGNEDDAKAAHYEGQSQAEEYERRTAWIIDAAKNAIPMRNGISTEDQRAHVAGYELALFRSEDVFLALAAFVFDNRNGAWHPEYRPLIEAGRIALEKAGWKP